MSLVHLCESEMRRMGPVLAWYHATMSGFEAVDARPARQRFHLLLAEHWRTWTRAELRVSHHAVERWMERWGPFESRDEAEVELLAVAMSATPVQEAFRPVLKVKDGEEWWAAVDGALVRLVVQDRTVVTVLPREPARMAG